MYYTEYFQSCNFACIHCSLPLAIVEVSGDCNDSIFYILTNIFFSDFFHFSKYYCRNFFRRYLLSFPIILTYTDHCLTICSFNNCIWHPHNVLLHFGVVKLFSHKSLDHIYSAFEVFTSLIKCGLSH
jgi:NAD-specific glutamate dehydrogenase